MPTNYPIRLKRSSDLSKRPKTTDLQVGQPAVNTNGDDPGLYFTDSAQSKVIKIGPCYVGVDAPNSNPDPDGSIGNSKGEFWLDTTNPSSPLLKVWEGSAWVSFGVSSSNTIWVNPNGDDGNPGTLPQLPKKTIKSALASASAGVVVQVAPGNYEEDNPLEFSSENVSVVGVNPESCVVTAQNAGQDLFHVLGGCAIENFSFDGDPLSQKAIFSFPPSSGPTISKAPTLRNCVNHIDDSITVLADGDLIFGEKSMQVANVMQTGQNSIGLKATNLSSIEATGLTTVYADKTAMVESGASISISNSKSVYGNYGLHAEGKSTSAEQSGVLSSIDLSGKEIVLGSLTTPLRPYQGQLVTVGTPYMKVVGFNISNQGLGYSEAPAVTLTLGSGPNAIRARAKATIKGGKVTEIEVLDSGNGIDPSDTIVVTFTGGSPAVVAVATPILETIYYTVKDSSVVSLASCTVTLFEGIPYTPPPSAAVSFYRASRITAVSHLMEYVGCGLTSPYDGGVTLPQNEAFSANGAQLFLTSLNQAGLFSAGKGFTVNQNTGEIGGENFEQAVVRIALPLSLTL